MIDNDLARRAEREVVEIEAFLEAWIRGTLDDSEETYGRFVKVLGRGFHIVPPEGEIFDRAGLVDYMVEQHGRDPETTRWVENVHIGHVGRDYVVVMFEEWQIRDGQQRGSLVSGVMQEALDTPNRVEWVHIHERSIPASP